MLPVLAVLALLWSGAGRARAQCRVLFEPDPAFGSTFAGGQTRFFIRGLTRNPCLWQVQPALESARAGITLAFDPENGFQVPGNSVGSGRVLVNVGGNVPPGTYPVRVRLNLIRVENGTPTPAPAQFVEFTLEVKEGFPAQSQLEVTPARLDFGETAVGVLRQRDLTLRNTGLTNLVVNFIAVAGEPASPFDLCGLLNTRFALAPGQARQIGVCFRPRATGSFADELIINSTDPVNGTLRVPLEGFTPGTQPPLRAELLVDRGCGASYRIGETVLIQYRVSRDATVTIRNRLPDGTERLVVNNRFVPGGTLQTFSGSVGEPEGLRRLTMEAVAGGLVRQADCSFVATRVIGPQLAAQIHTDQGCLETGRNVVYFVGDPISVQVRVDGADQVLATIENVSPGEQPTVIFRQTIPGNRVFQLDGTVGPKLGRRGLRLTAQAGSQAVSAGCSYYANDETAIMPMRLRLVKVTNAVGGSKVIAGKLPTAGGVLTPEGAQFAQALQNRLNAIWDQVKIQFTIEGVDEMPILATNSFQNGVFQPVLGLDAVVSAGAREMFEFLKPRPGVLHVFLVERLPQGLTGWTVSRDANGRARDPREEATTPGNAIVLAADAAYAPFVSQFGVDSRSRTAEEALAESIAHDLGHALGLPDIPTSQSDGSWRNLMWADPWSRVGIGLGTGNPGAGFGLTRGQTRQSRVTATGLWGQAQPQ
jgi:hypothetical protein